MSISERVYELASKVRQQKGAIETEEATKNAFVMPFISTVLGYDVFNPSEVIPEFTADVGVKRGEKIAIGDPTVRKEFSFAGDTVAAVWTLVNQAEVFVAVIGSGRGHSIQEWIEACYSTVGKDWRQYVSRKENYTAEYRVLVSNPALIKSLGWEPRTSIDELARMMIEEGE